MRVSAGISKSRRRRGDFPRGLVDKTLPSNAGNMGLIPSWGTKILYAATKDPVCCNQDLVRPNKYLKEKKTTKLSPLSLFALSESESHSVESNSL